TDAVTNWLTFSPDGRWLAADFTVFKPGGFGGRVEWWSASDGRSIGRVDDLYVTQFLDDGATLVLLGREPNGPPDGDVWVEFWDVEPPRLRGRAPGIAVNVARRSGPLVVAGQLRRSPLV